MTPAPGFAVLGYGVRFPGAADTAAFWDLLADGREAVSVVPADRWDADEFFDLDPDAPGKMVTRHAGFIDDLAGFDAPFFGVSTREAMFMDPQHRLILETTWSAVEHAGIAPFALSGTRTGVFVGLSTHEYAGMMIRLSALEDIDFHSGTGTSAAAAAGRVSFRMGLQGPAVVVDTACSSSLVAAHQACQALAAGDCDLALVGGVNAILTPIPMINFSHARMLAPDGRCKTFDAAADGYVRGEGCGVIVLKRLEDATRDGDRIRAVIRGSAVNQDGASGGLTVPNGVAQQRVIADALHRAGVNAGDVDYLEAHGTGTSLGDPIEAQAAGAVFGQGRESGRPLLIGSVKTNIGHLEAASGIAGLIKVALALEREVLPKHLHFRQPSPYIPWSELPIRVVDEALPWPRTGRPRIAGVSSFGFSGTNAHLVIEEAPAPTADAPAEPAPATPRLLPLSARTPEVLSQMAFRYRDWLDANPEADFADVCATAGAARSHFEHRAALVVDSPARARRLLRAFTDDRPVPGLLRGVCGDRPKTAWLFPGQGSQLPGMAQALFHHEPVFRETVVRCAEVLDGTLARPLLDVLFGDETSGAQHLRDTAVVQPALFAIEMGLARLWESWGIQPDVVLGHSVGQYAAACVAGVFGIDDGARLIAERGRLFGHLPAGGRMLAVFTDPDRVEQCVEQFPRLSVAAYNGANTVLSGPAADAELVEASFTASGIRCEWLDTSHAFHSALMDPALDEFESYANGFDYAPPRIMLICNRTGDVFPRRANLDAQYWRRHARQPVHFEQGVRTLARLGCAVLMELGPQPVLTAAAIRAWPEDVSTPQTIASLRRDVDAHRCMTEAVAAAYISGHQLDFAARRHIPHRTVDLPTYPFQHRPYWFPAFTDPETAKRARVAASWSGEPHAAEAVAGAAEPNEPALVANGAGDWLLGVATDERADRVAELIRAELADALRMSAAEIDPHVEFLSLGMDSLTAMELRRRLQTTLGTEIPASLVFAHPTASALAEGLLAVWQQNPGARRSAPIPRVARDGDLPLSHAQEQLWFLNQLLPSSSAYNVAARLSIEGQVDRDLLRRSLAAVVDRHEVLRTKFVNVQGVPRAVQQSAPVVDVPLERLHSAAEIDGTALREACIPFDIAEGPLLRARLFDVGRSAGEGHGDRHHVLVLTMHHIITDGWSFRALLSDLAQAYRRLADGEPNPLAELPIQYADYAQWQREQLQGPNFEGQLEYWRNDLDGASPLELDTDRPRPRIPSFRGARIRFELGRDCATALSGWCRAENVTVSVPLLAAFATLLSRYSGQRDIVVGTLTANRPRAETVEMIGLFVNSLPVRIKLDDESDTANLLAQIKQRMIDALAHEDVPFDLIVNAVAPVRDANRAPIFNVQLVVQPTPDLPELNGLGIAVEEIDTQTAKRDLTLTFFDDAVLSGHIEYATDLFDAVRIERMLDHFRTILDAMVADPGQAVSDLPMLTASDRVHYEVNAVPRTSAAQSVPELFELSADLMPDAVAVRFNGGSLTYRELDVVANRLARRLRSLGVRPGTPVGLSVQRTAAVAIGMLGILKAGGIYVPIDPAYPQDRIDHIRRDAGVALLLRDDDVDSSDISALSADRLESGIGSEDLAYVMYTSGSTGRPKGVAISHSSAVEYAETLGHELGITADDVFLQTASISFSSSIRQLLVPFATGAQVLIATSEERRDPKALLRRIRESGVTVADLVPAVVRGVVDAMATETKSAVERSPERLRLLLTASEPLRAGTVRAWRERMGSAATWINMYGQTETTGIVSLHRVDEEELGDDHSIVPIGRPRANVGMYVLDRELRLVPPGVTGELFISGPALALGYLGDPGLDAAKFVYPPWAPAERLYASGDAVRLRWDGTIEFRNRIDRQVKIRGLRVEPAEVDGVLLDHPAVAEVVTVARTPLGQDSVLVSYFVPVAEPVSANELRARARRALPDHMVPAVFVALERLPRTPNGKLDRTALPDVTMSRDQEIEYIAPRSGVEESLAAIWRDSLGVEQIGAGDNFFALGGHSLLAAQVRSRIHQALEIELPLEALFEDQTLADLARRIEATNVDDVEAPPLLPAERTVAMPGSYAQELMWQAEVDTPGSPANWIDVSIRIAGPLDAPTLVRSVQRTAARHALLRTVFRSSGSSVTQLILDSWEPDVPVCDGHPPAVGVTDPQWHDLDVRPPWRAEVFRIADDHHILRLRAHRILGDGYSTRLLLSEVGGQVANSLGFGEYSPLDCDLQYADYAVWERAWLTGDALARRVDHFRREFEGITLPPALPTDHPRAERLIRVGRQIEFELPRADTAAARALAVREEASLYTVLLAAFASAVGRYAQQPMVMLAAPVARRNDRQTQLMLGPFINTVPLRINLDAADDLPALVRGVKSTVLGALSNQDAPWQHVLSALTAMHGPHASRIGQLGFLMDDPAPGEFSAGGFNLTRVPQERVVARRELTVAMSTRRGQITGMVTYDEALFEPRTINGIIADFIVALSVSPSEPM